MTEQQPLSAPRLSAEELNRGNPNHDSYWQARGFKKRPKDWKQRIEREKDAKAKQLQREQKAVAREARQARREREQEAAYRGQRERRTAPTTDAVYDPFRLSRADRDESEARA